jgi:serine/threonine-protein kinase HipA
MVDLEAACLRLAREVELTTISTMTETIGDIPCIIVSRFDREQKHDEPVLRRIHQEDACQALGIDTEPNARRGKYQRHGGPSLYQIARLLNAHAIDGQGELLQLARAVAFTIAIGNADAHGKNIALLHNTEGTIQLAPLYDTVPTLLWPKLRTEAAMSVAGCEEMLDISKLGVSSIVAEAKSWSLNTTRCEEAVIDLLENLMEHATKMDIPEELAALITSRVDVMLSN